MNKHSQKYSLGDIGEFKNGKYTLYDADNSKPINIEAWAKNLTSLEGGPNEVVGYFFVDSNELTSLEGGPKIVHGNYIAGSNRLISLLGAPKEVGLTFKVDDNKLTSLEFAPSKVGASFRATNNNLTNLHNIHRIIKFIGSSLVLRGNPIESHILGLLKIEGLLRVYLNNGEIEKIINKYLTSGRDILDCQEELIEAGFPEYAQL